MAAEAAPAGGEFGAGKKRKIIKYHNQRAHANPLSGQRFMWCPWSPATMNWAPLYPALFDAPAEGAESHHKHWMCELKQQQGEEEKQQHQDAVRSAAEVACNDARVDHAALAGGRDRLEVTMADVGCGYGGLTVALGTAFPGDLVLGMELRDRVAMYVQQRIEVLRAEHPCGKYDNVAVERANCMKSLPCYFHKAQLKKIFFCFPDPHFKKKNHRRRIINDFLLAEYAFVLRPGGMLYCVTDVLDLHVWMRDKCTAHPLFTPLTDEEMDQDAALKLAMEETEESKKVVRQKGSKYRSVFRRK